jgi:hypothetical protein
LTLVVADTPPRRVKTNKQMQATTPAGFVRTQQHDGF